MKHIIILQVLEEKLKHGKQGQIKNNKGKVINDYSTLPEEIQKCNNYRAFRID